MESDQVSCSLPEQKPTPVGKRAPIAIRYDESVPEDSQCSIAPPSKSPSPPNGAKRVLLHSCCSPCSGAMIEQMTLSGLEVTIFFYNPNIHPRLEYDIRKNENKRYADALNIPFVDCDYDTKEWFKRAKGLEYEPERGARCTMCFDMRLERTALYASENGFTCFTTTNATSRWKDQQQVNASGLRAAAKYEGIDYWVYDWQTEEMTKRKYEISAEHQFYKQEYCGCSYSLRDSNLWRQSQGIGKIRIGGEVAGLGNRYFSDPLEDALEESQEVVDSFFNSCNGSSKTEGTAETSTIPTSSDNTNNLGSNSAVADEQTAQVYKGRKKNVQVLNENNW